MTNLTITNNNIGSVILQDAQFRDELLTFAGAGTVVQGTVLARQAVAIAVTEAADGGNTGDGTITLATVVAGPAVPLVGTYVLTVTTAVTHGGILQLKDPNGAIVASDLIMTAGAGAATVFEAVGLEFTITDGATDLIVGDFFTMIVAADGKMVVFAVAGAGGAQVPKQIVTYDVVAAGAGDESIRSGVAGSYRKERLVIDGSAAGVGITDAIIDQLRDYNLVPIDVQELNILDNQ